ncbi:MAG: hypothetical protein WBM99_11500, partial [Psychromonas sp.]
ADLKDDLLTELGYTNVSAGVYNCPSCDDDVYANVSLDADDKLETSCSLEEDATTSEDEDTVSEDTTASEAVDTVSEAVATVAATTTYASTTAALTGFVAAYAKAKAAAASAGSSYVSGSAVLANYEGTLQTVDSTLMAKLGLTGALNWKADTNFSLNSATTELQVIMYAGTGTGNNSYFTSLVYYNGSYYYSATPLSITGLGSAVESSLISRGFVKVT